MKTRVCFALILTILLVISGAACTQTANNSSSAMDHNGMAHSNSSMNMNGMNHNSMPMNSNASSAAPKERHFERSVTGLSSNSSFLPDCAFQN